MPFDLRPLAGALLAVAAATAAEPPAAPRPPNIVHILLDDAGASDAGFAGSRFYETPNLDRLAREGMVFRHAYAAGPNCAPTRAALMTGMYPARTGIYTVGSGARGPADQRLLVPAPNRTELDPRFATWAQRLHAAGYVTGIVGKWHLGERAGVRPADFGFDEVVGGGGGGTRSFHAPYGLPGLPDGPPGEHLTDRLGEEAAGFIARNAQRPFCLFFSQFAVHTPIQPRADLVGRFRDRTAEGEQRSAEYAAHLYGADLAVGRVLAELERRGLAQDTVVIATSDNGGVQGITGNAPFRGYKGMLYEGGIRVPMAVRWPARVAAGSLCDVPVSTIDMHPTFLELARAPVPPDAGLDGESIVPLLTASGTLRREALIWHFPGYLETREKDAPAAAARDPFRTRPVGAIRVGRWKLLEFFEDGRRELYDLEADPGETTDRAAAEPDRANALQARLAQWRTATTVPMPTAPAGR